MRALFTTVYVGLVALLLGLPTPTRAGDYGCHAGYYPGYARQVQYVTSYPTYTPAYPQPVVAANTNYQQDYGNVLFRIAPDLAQARLAEETARQTLQLFEAKLAKQAADAAAATDRQQNRDFQLKVIELLGRTGAPAPPAQLDPQQLQAVQQLQAENAQMRAALEKIAAARQGATGAPPAAPDPAPQPPPPLPDLPRASAPPPAAGPNPNAAAVARTKELFAKSCMPCHAANNPQHLTDLTRPELLSYEKCTDCIRRMITNRPNKVMPKDKPPGTAPLELVGAVEDLAETAPHDPRLK